MPGSSRSSRGPDPFQRVERRCAEVQGDAQQLLQLSDTDILTLVEQYEQAGWEHRHHGNCDESVYVGGPGISVAMTFCGASKRRLIETGNTPLAAQANFDSSERRNQSWWYLQNPQSDRSSRSRGSGGIETEDLTAPWSRRTERPRHPEVRTSIMCGHAGVLLAQLAWCREFGSANEGSAIFDQQQIFRDLCAISNEYCDADEWLYGRSGYLLGLLSVRQWMAEDAGGQLTQQAGALTPWMQGELPTIDDAIRRTVRSILSSGRQLSQQLRRDPVLGYRWCDENYIGAAHGLCGIYYALLCAHRIEAAFLPSKHDLEDLERSINWLLDHCKLTSNGNYPATWEQEYFSPKSHNRADRPEEGENHLVHFCHGAPGFVYLLLEAHRTFGQRSARYMEEALALGEFVFRHGVLKKGVGLCHGTAGNGFVFLALSRAFPDDKRWLKYARHYCAKVRQWVLHCEALDRKWCDHPWSLYEGLAGTCVFLYAFLLHVAKQENSDSAADAAEMEALPSPKRQAKESELAGDVEDQAAKGSRQNSSSLVIGSADSSIATATRPIGLPASNVSGGSARPKGAGKNASELARISVYTGGFPLFEIL
ncbi:unnamed protein product [Amoebophrya sp. A120]|nr:unnamed protein product [Amoebophrya sp. A120]|eukprot:GSA120T00005515001.1